MPFQPGNQLAKNRKNAKGGRPTVSTEEELRSLLDESWPASEKTKAVKIQAQRAARGDLNALRFLMSYRFGTPPNGDEMRVQEAVDDATESLLQKLESHLAPDAWAQVEKALGIEGD